MMRYALISKAELASPAPGGMVRHQECGGLLKAISNGRYSCAMCLKKGYLLEAPNLVERRGRRE